MSDIPDPPPRYRFADLTVDLGQRRVWRGTEPIELGKLSFDLLRVLVAAAPNAVANDDLASKVWGPRRIVTPENLSRRLLLLRESLGDDSNHPRYVGGVRGYGYRLIPEVEKLPVGGEVHVPISRDAPVADPATPQAPVTRASAARAAIRRAAGVVASLLLLAALAWWVNELTDQKSIAVLPFADLSASQDQDWLSDGVAEDLTRILTRIPQFRVAAFGSAFSLRGRNLSDPEIGQILNVRYLLEGSVRRDGDRLRVGAWLVDSTTDTQIWSASYLRTNYDLFQVQQEIAAAVAEALRIRLLGPIAPVDITTPEVYELYRRGEQIARSGIVMSLPEARAKLEEAVAKDPTYLPARMQLVYVYAYIPYSGTIDATTAQALSSKTLDEAAAIWPDRAEVNSARGYFAAQIGDLAAAAGYLERALAAEPDDGATLNTIVSVATDLNRAALAMTFGEYVEDRGGTCAVCRYHLMRAYFLARKYSEAGELYERTRALSLTSFADFHYVGGNALLQAGEAERALAAYREMEPNGVILVEADKLTGIAIALHALGRETESEAEFHQLRELARTADVWLNVASVHAYKGDLDSAFEVLNAAPSLSRDSFDLPPLTDMRGHPRWQGLAEKAGIWPKDPRDLIEFDVALPE